MELTSIKKIVPKCEVKLFVVFTKVLIFDVFYSPEAMGLVTGCIFLVSLFLFIPFPFSNYFFKDDHFSHEEVSVCYVSPIRNDFNFFLFSL